MCLKYFFYHDTELIRMDILGSDWAYYVVLALVVLSIVFVAFKYKNLSNQKRKAFMTVLVLLMPLVEIARSLWHIIIGQYLITQDLPIQLCRIMMFAAPLAYFTNSHKLKTFCYCIGVPGAIFAFVFSTVRHLPILTFEVVRYVDAHFLIILVPILWVAGDGFIPKYRSIWAMISTVLAIAVFYLGLNYLLGSNYLYVNYIPEHVNIHLAQPWYFLALVSLMIAVVTLMLVPFGLKKSFSIKNSRTSNP